MSADRDETRIVRSWLEDGATMLPDRVLDAVLDQLPATPQRRAGWLARRFPPLNNTMKLAVAAAFVLVVALVGIGVMGPRNNPGTTSTTATPSPTPRIGLPLPGSFEPGTYRMAPRGAAPATFTYTVPAGWAMDADHFVNKDLGGPREVAFATWEITHVFGDGCHTEGTIVQVGPTVDDLVTGLMSQANREISGPTDVDFAGYPAKRVELFVPADWEDPDCPLVRNWPDAGGSDDGGWRARPGQTDVVYIFEVDGKRVVFSTWHMQDTPAADLAELDDIIASIEFE
jgi:hypothetical protein